MLKIIKGHERLEIILKEEIIVGIVLKLTKVLNFTPILNLYLD